MVRIELKDKVLSHEQFSNLQYAINGLLASGRYRAEQIHEFHASPVLSGPQYGFYQGIYLEVDEDIAEPLRAVLMAFGFLERPRQEREAMAGDKNVKNSVAQFVAKAVQNAKHKIEWAIWYDLEHKEDVSLLYIAENIPVSLDGKLDVFQFVAEPDIHIPGKLLITISSIEELSKAYTLAPDQKIVACLQGGDYEIIQGPPERITDALPWVNKESQGRATA